MVYKKKCNEFLVKDMITKYVKGIMKEIEYDELSELDYKYIVNKAYDDLEAYAQKDPSSGDDDIYILKSYSSYYAVLSYRIANYIYNKGNKYLAKKISEIAKIRSGIEIHPAATIGKRFVVDHGVGTVIGETVVIGNDCYLLQDVVLGSSSIANNIVGKRHPTLGNNVEIGSFVKVYGRIRIGDNVKISPGAIIKKSIPNNSKVIVNSNYQVLRTKEKFNVYFLGYFLDEDDVVLIFDGDNLSNFNDITIESNGTLIEDLDITNCTIKFKYKFNLQGEIVILFDYVTEMRISLRLNALRRKVYDNQRVLQ